MANIIFEKRRRAITISPEIQNNENRGAKYETQVVPEQKSLPFSLLELAEIQYSSLHQLFQTQKPLTKFISGFNMIT